MELVAEKRQKFGKKAKTVKETGAVPGVVFGKNFESLPISLNSIKFKKVFNQAGETDLIDLKVGEDQYKILIKDVQLDPVTNEIIHTSLYKPNLMEKIEAQIPVEVIGEDKNELIKSGNAMVFYVVDEITVEALPTDLPHAFVIDVSEMTTLGEGVPVSSLNYDKSKVEIVDLEPEEFVIRLDEMEEQVEEEETTVSEEEAIAGVEATKEKKEDEEEDLSQEKKPKATEKDKK